jgi:hypothetical protein
MPDNSYIGSLSITPEDLERMSAELQLQYVRERQQSIRTSYTGSTVTWYDLGRDTVNENETMPEKIIDILTGEELQPGNAYKVYKNVTYTEEDGWKYDIVYASTNEYTATIHHSKGGTFRVCTREEAQNMGYFESLKDGIFYETEALRDELEYEKNSASYTHHRYYPDNKKYGVKFGSYSPTDILTQDKGYTFGVEIETCGGFVDRSLFGELNMKSVKDGSITVNGSKFTPDSDDYIGREYVTGVLTGDAGFKHLQKIVHTLKERCVINKTCSIHAHIGGADFDKAFNVYAYKLALAIENDMFSMLPPSRKNNTFCKFLPPLELDIPKRLGAEEYDIIIDEHYRTIFQLMCNREPSHKVNKGNNHPNGSRAGYNQSHPRYSWLNFLTSMFNTKNVRDNDGNILSYTLEFRNHSASLNYNKIRNWILLCMGFVYCVENHKTDIAEGKIKSMEDIINRAYKNKRKDLLLAYISERKDKFSGAIEAKRANEAEEYTEQDPSGICSFKEIVQ